MKLKEFLYKITTRIKVHKPDILTIDKPKIHKLKKSMSVHKTEDLSFDVNIISGDSLEILTLPKISVHGFHVKKLTKKDIHVNKMQKTKLTVHRAVKAAQSLPIELENKLKYQKSKPIVAQNESILAWYSPIVDNAVIKLALNKQRGTLLVWYNPSSKQVKTKGLYLIRRLGLGEKPEWRWV